ncbi:MAG: DNA polymerase IV [Acidimicrobiales bacterium]
MAEWRAGPTGSAPSVAGGSSTWDRVILHVDMDAFFASVEVLDDPSLRGLPVIVGGSGSRGVVAACTYEARMFGVHSAMPSSMARRLCPAAVFVDGRFHRYMEESAKLHDIFESVTPLVEGISLDEAFLDVTGSRQLLGDGVVIAESIRRRVAEELELTCSVGVGRSKLMAKLASKAAKPVADRGGITPGPGVVVVPPDGELEFLHPLPVRALWGVGPVTGRRLAALGINTVGDIAALAPGALERYLGVAQGAHLAALSRGHDPRPVVPDQEAKSIGHEETFESDLWDRDELQRQLVRMVDASATALRRAELSARTVSVKIRFGDFTLITRSHTMGSPIDASPAIGAVAAALLDSVELTMGVRLLGVSLSGFGREEMGTQLSLDLGSFDPGADHRTVGADSGRGPGPVPENAGGPRLRSGRPDQPVLSADDDAERIQRSWGPVTAAVDAIRARYGGSSVGPASLVGEDGLRIRRRGEAQWGPSTAAPQVGDDE